MCIEMAGAKITKCYMYNSNSDDISIIIYSISKQLGRKFTNFSMQIIIR